MRSQESVDWRQIERAQPIHLYFFSWDDDKGEPHNSEGFYQDFAAMRAVAERYRYRYVVRLLEVRPGYSQLLETWERVSD